MKAFCDSSGSRSAGGRLFQVVGKLTAKLCCPTAIRTRGINRIQLDAERKFCRVSTRRGRGRYAEVAEVGKSMDRGYTSRSSRPL